jgi:hypothetical protein
MICMDEQSHGTLQCGRVNLTLWRWAPNTLKFCWQCFTSLYLCAIHTRPWWLSYVLISIERVFGFIDDRWFQFSKCFRITELSVPWSSLVKCNVNTIKARMKQTPSTGWMPVLIQCGWNSAELMSGFTLVTSSLRIKSSITSRVVNR